MITTIDRAGRIVIPKELRERFNFAAGSQIEIQPEANGLRLNLPNRAAVFREKKGVLVDCSETASTIDATAFINALRDSRSTAVVGPPES
ncbi:MAG: AbrB/MazE/SpoVT family DNA-binding domain-containing protein [Opitutales bacterium]